MIRDTFFLGFPEDFQGICEVYPPKVKVIVGDKRFPLYRRLLTLCQEDIEDEYKEKEIETDKYPTPLEYLLISSFNSAEVRAAIEEAFQLFCHSKITFLFEQKKILLGDLGEVLTGVQDLENLKNLKFLDESNFFEFQNLVRESLGEKPIEKPNPKESKKVREMKAKVRARERLKAKKGIGISFGTTLVSICCMGLGLSPLSLGELSYCAVLALVRQYQEKEKYQLDIDRLLAGADSKNIHPKYWMRDLDNE